MHFVGLFFSSLSLHYQINTINMKLSRDWCLTCSRYITIFGIVNFNSYYSFIPCNTTLCTMNISKNEYCYDTDILYNNELKEIKPIVIIIPHHLAYVWPEVSRATPKISAKVLYYCFDIINPVKNKNNLSCVYTFSALRSKHGPSRLRKTVTQFCTWKEFLFLLRSI